MIRRARPADAKGIHEAHMLSIQTICSKDHSPEEINAWGGRPFNEAQRISAIQNQHVWVVEIDHKIEGYGHLRIYDTREDVSLHKPHPEAYLLALEKLNISTLDAMIFEDSEAGGLAARAAKCQFIFVQHNFNQRHSSDGASRVIDSFKELRKVF